MKKIFAIMALVAVTFVASYAQNADAKAKSFVSKVNTAVALKGDQFTKVNTIATDFFNKKAAVQADTNLSPKEADEKLANLQTERDNKLKAVLTPEQWAKYEKEANGTK